MQTINKEQGFILSRSRFQSADNKHSSQAELASPKKFRVSHRSPGSILKIRHKQDIGMIRSFFSVNKNRDSVNNQENGSGIKYQYQEINKVIEVRDDDDKVSVKSYQQLQQDPYAHKLQNQDNQKSFSLKSFYDLYKHLKKILFVFENGKSNAEILFAIESYLKFVQNQKLDDLSDFKISSLNKKTIRNAILNERLSVITLTNLIIKDDLLFAKKYIHNMLSYSIDSYFIIANLLSQGKYEQFTSLFKQQEKQKLLQQGYGTLRNNNEIISQSINKISRHDNQFYEEMKKICKKSKSFSPGAAVFNILEYVAFHLWNVGLQEKCPFLAISPQPYLPQLQFQRYTLVLDFVEVFCCRNKKFLEAFRPFSQYFLDEMNKYYQIIAISDSMPNQINKAISLLDRKKLIKHRLYRYHLQKDNGIAAKNLKRIGRNLDQVILIDSSTSFENENVISISPWRGKKSDADLAEICPLLAMIALKKLKVPKTLKKYREKIEQNYKLGLKYTNYAINLD